MSYVTFILLLASLTGHLPFAIGGGYFQAYKPPIEAKTGDVATGTVVRQDAQTLILNTTPCNGDREKQVVIFHSPFGTKSAEPILCPGGKTLQQIVATQQ
jgi:hypothetical protein